MGCGGRMPRSSTNRYQMRGEWVLHAASGFDFNCQTPHSEMVTALDVIREIEALPGPEQKLVAAYVRHRDDPRRMACSDFAEPVHRFQSAPEGTPEADALWNQVVEEIFGAPGSHARHASDSAAA